jgi:hypothetical protein
MQVAVAQQIYDYVDQRIRRLDKDLKAFDAELTKDRIRQGLPVWSSLNLCCAQRQSAAAHSSYQT